MKRFVRSLLIASCLAHGLSWGHDGLDEQIEAVSVAIAANPGNAALYLRRADLFRLHAEFAHAHADLATARRLNALVPGLDRGLAMVLMDQGDPGAARAALDRHVAAMPTDGAALALRADCHQRLGEAEAARADLDAALGLLHQPDPDLICQLATLLHRAGRTDEALARLDAAIAISGAVPAFLETALAIEIAAERVDAALTRLDGLSTGPAPAQWLERRADLLREVGRHAEASAAYRAAATALQHLPAERRATTANQVLAARIADALSTRPTDHR